MSQEGYGTDLSAGESSIDQRRLQAWLDKEIWRHQWEKGLAVLAVALVLIFYIMLLGFIFVGHFRLVIGESYWHLSTKPHLVTDVPIIIALASVPTIILIALLRYFHYRDKPNLEDAPLPLSLQSTKDVIDLIKS